MNRVVRTVRWSGGLVAALVVATVLAATIGPVALDAQTVVRAVLSGIAVPVPQFVDGRLAIASTPLASAPEGSTVTIVRSIRLPRIALAAVVGAALAAAGTIMQGLFRNPMADPSIVGVSAGAAVGAVGVIVLPAAIPFGLQTAAFTGALVTAFGVYLLATRGGRTPVATLLLAGVAVQTLLGAALSVLLLHAGHDLERAMYWLMGDLRNATWGEVGVTLAITLFAVAALLPYARSLNVLLLGEGDAATLGIPVERTKRILLALSAVVTGGAVAVAGVIGFVGLIVPHVMRLLVGPDHRILLPTSTLLGATFLVAADTLARSGPAELPVGIVTAAVGAPFFLALLRRREVSDL
ncbi:vitamin B12 ABC transporter permease BtuC [Halococcoides cellulosivorans]|nr:vitamin B12 ABC transporter permease BtuC [Halococcoides cellulosivorans]